MASTQHTLSFLRAFLANPTKVGAIAPSSPALAREMVRGLSLNSQDRIVEFGPGTGPFTEAIAEIIDQPEQYLGMERDRHFVDILQNRFPQLSFVCDGAQQTLQYLTEQQIDQVKTIVCGLPFASLPPSVQDAVIATLDKLLQNGGEFRTFQYVHAYPMPTARRFRTLMQKLFGPCQRSKIVMRNFPPAYVLKWKR